MRGRMVVLRWKQMVSTVLEKLSTVPEDGLGDEERESCDENERGRDSIVEAEVEFMAYIKHLKEQYTVPPRFVTPLDGM